MKRFAAIVIAMVLTLSLVCTAGAEAPAKKLSVVSTIFPQYDWVRQVIGDKADAYELTLLLDKGVDLHSYQPTVDDLVKVRNIYQFSAKPYKIWHKIPTGLVESCAIMIWGNEF